MTHKFRWSLLLSQWVLFISTCFSFSVYAVTINVVTENEFPLQHIQNGKLTGPSYKVVQAVLNQAGFEHEAHVLPWSRAYNIALNQPNTLIFSIVRTAHRESLFEWIGEIHKLQYALIKLKSRTDLKIDSLSNLGVNRIGVIRDSAVHLFFKGQGLDYNLIVSGNEQPLYNVLLKERVEFIPRNKLTIPFDCVQWDLDCNQFEIVKELNEFSQGFYLAMSKNTDAQVLERIQNAFLQLQRSGDIDVIMKTTYSAQNLQVFKQQLEDKSLKFP